MEKEKLLKLFGPLKGLKLRHVRNIAIVVALYAHNGNRKKAANALDISLRGLRLYMNKSPFIKKHFPMYNKGYALKKKQP